MPQRSWTPARKAYASAVYAVGVQKSSRWNCTFLCGVAARWKGSFIEIHNRWAGPMAGCQILEVDDIGGGTGGGGEEKKERSDGGQEWFHGVVLR